MIIGHQKQKEKLKMLLEKEEVPHAFLFSGPEKVGKKRTAIRFLKMANCTGEGKNKPCEKCQSCLEIEKEKHPDITQVIPEKGEIRMEQVEEAAKKVCYKCIKANLKGVVIDDAHLMNLYSQNAMLKILEEPPENTVFFLVTGYPHMLFSTVRSRLFELKFSAVSEEEIRKAVKDERTAFLSLGKPGVAFELAASKEKKEEAERMRREVKEVIKSDIGDRFLKAKEIVKKETVEDFLEYLLRLLQEKMKKEMRENRNTEKTRKALFHVQEALFLKAKTNINPQLVLEQIMLKI